MDWFGVAVVLAVLAAWVLLTRWFAARRRHPPRVREPEGNEEEEEDRLRAARARQQEALLQQTRARAPVQPAPVHPAPVQPAPAPTEQRQARRRRVVPAPEETPPAAPRVVSPAVPPARDEAVEPRDYRGGNAGAFVSCIGWDGAGSPAIAEPGGALTLGPGRRLRVRFALFPDYDAADARTHVPFEWSMERGWLPCLVTRFRRFGCRVSIATFADRVPMAPSPCVVAFARVRIANVREVEVVRLDPRPSPAWVALRQPQDARIAPGAAAVYDYAVVSSVIEPRDDEWADAGDVAADGVAGACRRGYDHHHARMVRHWEQRLAGMAQVRTTDAAADAAIRASIVYTHMIRKGTELHVGANGYETVYDHDFTGTAAALLQFGCGREEAHRLLTRLPTGTQFDDATWKYAWPHALYILKSGDLSAAAAAWPRLRAAAHKVLFAHSFDPAPSHSVTAHAQIAADRATVPGFGSSVRVMKETNDIDSRGRWTVDAWSAMTGLLAYARVAQALGQADECAWAEDECGSLLEACNACVVRLGLGHIPASLVEPNTANRCREPRDANWAAQFFFGRWALEGWLMEGARVRLAAPPAAATEQHQQQQQQPLRCRQTGPSLDLIDATYDRFLLPHAGQQGRRSFGGYPPCLHSTAYNAAYGAAGLRGARHRALAAEAMRFMTSCGQSGPNAWWESAAEPLPPGETAYGWGAGVGPGAGRGGAWAGTHPARGQGSCPHVWGQMSSAKAVLDAVACEFHDGWLLVGRGVPWEWLAAAQPAPGPCVAVARLPIAGGRRADVELWTTREADCAMTHYPVVAPGAPGAPRTAWAGGGTVCWARVRADGGPLRVLFSLPCFVRNIAGATAAGVLDQGEGWVAYDAVVTPCMGVALHECP